MLKKSETPKFPGSSYLNADANIEKFKNIDNYGIVIIDTHGAVLDGDHLFATGVEVNDVDDVKYENDINAGRIAKGKVRLLGLGPSYYLVSSQFLKKYSGDMPNSLVYISACKSLFDIKGGYDELELALRTKNLGAVIGYNRTVTPYHTAEIGASLFKYLLEGDTVKIAADKAEKDASFIWKLPYFAKLVVRGKNDLKIVDRTFKNGGFEEGLDYWNSIGNSRINKSDYIPPAEEGANRMINDSVNGTISQTFKIPDNATILSYYYLLFAESRVYYDTDPWFCDGKFTVTLTDSDDNETIIGKYDYLNIYQETKIGLDNPYFGYKEHRPPNDGAWFATDWKHVEFPVSSFAGKVVTLSFKLNFTRDMGTLKFCANEMQLDNVSLY